MSSRFEMIGASKSLRKTINEIESFLEGEERLPDGKLRGELNELLADFAEKWLKHGFRGGCILTKRHYEEKGRFPKRVSRSVKRVLFAGCERDVQLDWKAKTAKKSKSK